MKLRFKSGDVLQVVRKRPDGWPLCPSCGADELGCVFGAIVATVDQVDFCYRCGPLEVVKEKE